MQKNAFVFPDPLALAESLAAEIAAMVNDAAASGRMLTIALSGGSTPLLLYSVLGDHFQASAKWEFAHFFWCDERCVDPGDIESNYGNAKAAFFDKINIPATNIHRIYGESEPDYEALRYSEEIRNVVRGIDFLPVFDLILLGVGNDGHIASIFPGSAGQVKGNQVCIVTTHPQTGQKRISVTLDLINNATSVIFMVTGSSKAEIIADIFHNPEKSSAYPASRVKPLSGSLKWYLDSGSGKYIAY